MVLCLVKNMAMVPLACSEWDPTFLMTKPKQSLGLSQTTSLTSWTMSLLCTCCHGREVASQKVQMRVSGVVTLQIMLQAHAMTAWTGQHGLSVVMAWWDKVLPLFPFFRLSS